MSDADKLFDELGYIKQDMNHQNYIAYFNECNEINFYLKDKMISANIDEATMQELKAINAKVAELGWSDE